MKLVGATGARWALVAALAAALVVAVATTPFGPAAAADKTRKNEGLVAPHFADYGVTRIGFGGLSSVERNAEYDRLFQAAVENGFAATKYRFQGLGTFQDDARRSGTAAAVAALQRAAFAGAAPDSATLAHLRGQIAVDAILFVNLTRMERNLIDQYTRGQASTDVGADFVLVAVKNGALLWHGNFAERGLGPYNDPNTAEVLERDPTGNATARSQALDPPPFHDVLDKLMRTVTASLPAPAAPGNSGAESAPASH
jgi:hypothetical protein